MVRVAFTLDDPYRAEELLEGLIARNRRQMRRGGIPPLYQSGILYREEPRGQEDWLTAEEMLKKGVADCEDLAGYRVAELREQGEKAKPRIVKTGKTTYHAIVQRADGSMEDPTKILKRMEAKGMLGLEEEKTTEPTAESPLPVTPASPLPAVPVTEKPTHARFKWRFRSLPGGGWAGFIAVPLHLKSQVLSGYGSYTTEKQIGWLWGKGKGKSKRAAAHRAIVDNLRKQIRMCQEQVQLLRAQRREALRHVSPGVRERILDMAEEMERRGRDRGGRGGDQYDEYMGFLPGLSSLFSMFMPGGAPAAPAAAPTPPAIPGIPSIPGLTLPGLPGAPQVPSMPQVPGLPFVPPQATSLLQSLLPMTSALTKVTSPLKTAAKKIKEGAKKFFKKLKFWGMDEFVDVL